MTTPQLIIVCATVLLLAAGYLYVRHQERRGRERAESAHTGMLRAIGDSLENVVAHAEQRAPGPLLVGKTVVVSTRQPDAQSVQGVVAGDYPDKIVLREATRYKPGGDPVAVPGSVEIERPVSTIQVVTRKTEE